MLLSAFKISQNSHPADCLGKSYGFTISWYLSYLFVIFSVSSHFKETDMAISSGVKKWNLHPLMVYLVPCQELCPQAVEVCTGTTELNRPLKRDLI